MQETNGFDWEMQNAGSAAQAGPSSQVPHSHKPMHIGVSSFSFPSLDGILMKVIGVQISLIARASSVSTLAITKLLVPLIFLPFTLPLKS